MSSLPKTAKVKLKQRQAAIMQLACFSMLSSAQAKELALLMEEQAFAAGDIIVKEQSLVDSVYILIKGKVEISLENVKKKRFSKKLNVAKVPVAILNPGESIGLNDTGFFSTTGKRTATATALKNALLLKIDLKNLQNFLQKYPNLLTELQAAAKKILRVRLIKQSLPFSKLSHDRILALAERIEEVKVPAGTIIFTEGEVGDRCYLIYSGKVEIEAHDETGEKHQLAVLQSPTLFGEATLITRTPRNATAIALTDCELLVLKHAYLSELIESENNVAGMFMNLMVDRSRPMKNDDVSVHERTTVDHQPIYILKNPNNGTYFKLSEEGWFVWQQMDGKRTMQEITLALAEEHQIFAPNVVAGLISKLAKSGFITHVAVDQKLTMSSQPLWIKAVLKVRCLLESRVALGDVDHAITRFYKRGGFLLFSRLGKILLTTLMIAGIYSFIVATPKVIHLFQTIHDSWFLLIVLVPFTLFSVALHEMGHALATKSYGHEVHYMGVGWYWLGPIAFTDTSDMWLSTKWPRVMVNLAGIYTDILVGGIAAMLIFVLPGNYVQAFLWLFALFTYVSAFRMLNPLQELDGYYVLMDLFDRPRLRQTAVLWLIRGFPKALKNPSLIKKNLPEFFYWVACFTFISLLSVVTYLLQTFIFKILEIQPANLAVSLALPIFVALISCIGIIADVRSQSED